MSLKSLGLLMNSSIANFENDLIENFLSEEEPSSENIEKVLSNYDINFLEEQELDLIVMINSLNDFVVQGYKTKEDYNKAKFEIISSGFALKDEALMSLRNTDFEDYELIKIRSENGELSDLFTKKEFLKSKSNLILSYIEKIKLLRSKLNSTNKRIAEITITENNPSEFFRDEMITKHELPELLNHGSLIYDEETKSQILSLLDKDQKILDNEILKSQKNPERIKLLELKSQLEKALFELIVLVDESVCRRVLIMSTSNIETSEILSILDLDLMKKNFYYQQMTYKYVIFAKSDIRDDLQESFKEKYPESKQNLKSRTMVEEFSLVDFTEYLSQDNISLILDNII